jgi:hypothetical protein
MQRMVRGTKYRGPSPSAQDDGGYYFDLEKLCGACGLAGLAAKDKGTFQAGIA